MIVATAIAGATSRGSQYTQDEYDQPGQDPDLTSEAQPDPLDRRYSRGEHKAAAPLAAPREAGKLRPRDEDEVVQAAIVFRRDGGK